MDGQPAARQRALAVRAPRLRILAMITVVLLGSAAACGSGDEPRTEVRGATVDQEYSNRGGPSAAVEEFRAGERASYGAGVPESP